MMIVPTLLGFSGCEAPEPDGRAPIVERSRLSKVRQGGTLRIEGIGPIVGWAKGRDNTFIHCLELVLDAAGRKIGYDELMGLSGLAFRIQFNVERWDVGNPDPLVGEECLRPLFAAIGMKPAVRVVRQHEEAQKATLRGEIKRSIEQGIPVLAANIIPPEDWGIITGYRPDGTWLCRSYNGGASRQDRPAKGWPTAVVLLKRRFRRPSPRVKHTESLRRAVKLFNQRKSGSYALGRKAFDDWCQSLKAVQRHSYIHPNIWTYVSLIDARGAAVRYLRDIAPEFGPRERYVLQAADLYEQEVRLLRRGYTNVPSERAFPDSLPPREYRRRQIKTLREAQKLEQQAIAALDRAVGG